MATYTEKLGLIKPAETEPYSLAVLNRNSDILDEFAKNVTKVDLIPGAGADIEDNTITVRYTVAGEIAAGIDLNTVVTPGRYRLIGNTNSATSKALNRPITSAGILLVNTARELVHQIYLRGSTVYNGMYIRCSSDSGTTWGSWARLARAEEVEAKQDRLTAGEGIAIGANNVISADIPVASQSGAGLMSATDKQALDSINGLQMHRGMDNIFIGHGTDGIRYDVPEGKCLHAISLNVSASDVRDPSFACDVKLVAENGKVITCRIGVEQGDKEKFIYVLYYRKGTWGSLEYSDSNDRTIYHVNNLASVFSPAPQDIRTILVTGQTTHVSVYIDGALMDREG